MTGALLLLTLVSLPAAAQLAKIPMPEKLRTLGKGMRLAGMGGQADAVIPGANRAAEAAAPKLA